MASYSKRGGLLRPATDRSFTDVSADWTEGADSNLETSQACLAGPNAQAKTPFPTAGDGRRDSRDFRYARLDRAELTAADFRHAAFDHASLAGANLAEANLSGALLEHADLSGAKLAGAHLEKASLRFATLARAELQGADLSGADLRYARLNGANVAGANLSGALLDYADLSGANLADARLCGAHLRYAKNLAPAQVLQARIDDATALPLHYSEPEPPKAAGVRARKRRRPLLAAGLAIGLIAALTGLGLVLQLQHSGGQAMSIVTIAAPVAPAAPVTPALASLAPEFLVPALHVETPDAVEPIAPVSLASMSLHPTLIARHAPVLASEILPVVSRPAPAKRVLIGDAALSLIASVPETAAAGVVSLERTEHAVAAARLALAIPATNALLRDVTSPVVAAASLTIKLRVREKAEKAPAHPAPASVDPLMLVVSLKQQKLEVYRGTTLVVSSKISSGKPGYDTRTGVFSILEKRRRHHSNLYSNAPMPWMQRMTWTGTALHAGVIPGYPASHGCVRLPFSFAPKLFQMTNVGENVVVANERVVPQPVEHPNLFQPASSEPQVSLARAHGGVAADANPIAAAGPGAPLRILVTRRTERDRIIAVQYLLASLGYLTPQNFTGRVGPETIAAIKAFQKANGLNATDAFSEDLAKAVYRVAGRAEPPAGHLYVRQDFSRAFDAPIAFRNPERTLGTHIFTAMTPAHANAKTPWIAVSLEGGDASSVFDRIEIPDKVREQISARLAPGSSLIIAETSVNSALLREGDDFMVWTSDAPSVAAAAPVTRQAKARRARGNQAKAALVGKPSAQASRKSAKRRAQPPGSYGGFWSFRRW